MAGIGLSKPYCALYNYDAETKTVSYTNGAALGKYTNLDISLNDGGENILYADNSPAESDKQFTGGTATLTVDELRPAVMVPYFGVKEEAIQTEGVATEGAAWQVYDDDQRIPYVGIGGIIKHKVDGVVRWMGFVLEKSQFATPGLSAVTQGQTVEWQTKAIVATILRSDRDKHPWFRKTTFLDSEAEAEAAVKAFLNIP